MPVGPYGALLDAVRGVRWPARRPVPGGAPGVHQARTRGIAPEFAEYRPYRQGDDPRRIDWKLLARSDKAFIRLAPDHATLGTTFLVDASASMGFAGKWTLAKRIVVALAAVAHASADPVGLIIASASQPRRLPARARGGVVAEIARTLDETTCAGAVELAPLVALSASRCVVITDALGDTEALLRALARHRAQGGEAHLLHVVAQRELEPGDESMLATDPEDERIARPLVPDTLEVYRSRFAEWRAELAHRVRADGIAYQELRDDAPVDQLVRRVVMPAGAEARR
jgi:uncharacterized protein (DUF58 family)